MTIMTTYYNPYYYPNYQRPEISYFSGKNVDGWLYELECFFYRYQTMVEQKLAIATSYLAGDALEWYRQWCWDMRLSWRIGTWDDFAADLRCRFWSESLTRRSVIIESMSKTCEGMIQLLTEMKNQNSVYMSDFSKLTSQLSTISTCGSSANKVEESDLNCELSAADMVSTDCEKFESASVAIIKDLDNPKSDEMNSEVVAQNLNLELHKKVLFKTVTIKILPVVEAEIGEGTKSLWFGAPFCTLSNIVTSCSQAVCENVRLNFPYYFSIPWNSTVGHYCICGFERMKGEYLTLDKPPPLPPEISGCLISYIVHLSYVNGGLKSLLLPSSNIRDYTLLSTMCPFFMQAPTNRNIIVFLVDLFMRGVSASVAHTYAAHVVYDKFLIQNQDELVSVGVDLGGGTFDALDFKSILMLKLAGYWSLALSSIQRNESLIGVLNNFLRLCASAASQICSVTFSSLNVVKSCSPSVYKIAEIILHIYYESRSKKVAQWVTKPHPMPPDILFIYTLLIEGKVIMTIHSEVLREVERAWLYVYVALFSDEQLTGDYQKGYRPQVTLISGISIQVVQATIETELRMNKSAVTKSWIVFIFMLHEESTRTPLFDNFTATSTCLSMFMVEAFQLFCVAEKISKSFLILEAFGNPKKVPSYSSSHFIGLCENFSDKDAESILKDSREDVARKLGKAILSRGSTQFVIACGSPTYYLNTYQGERRGRILFMKEDDQQGCCSYYLRAFYVRLGITEFSLDYLILQPTRCVADCEHKFSPWLSLMWRNCWNEPAAWQPSCSSPLLNILKVAAFSRLYIEFYKWMLAPLVEDMASVAHLLDHAHFIITNTYQEVAQVDDSHQGVTLTGPYRGIQGIDAVDTVFNISPGVDMTIYFSYNDDYKRLTTRHESIEARLGLVKNLMIWLFETTFHNLDIRLDDHAILVRYINKFIMFSLPRPPEMADLEDNVNFKGRGMLRTQYYLNKGV